MQTADQPIFRLAEGGSNHFDPIHDCNQLQDFVAFGMITGVAMPRKITGYVSEGDLAKRLDMSVWGLRLWRRKGYGPAAVKFGRAVFYPEAGVDEFMANPGAGQ